ncbi:MAG: efflux RND transporter permease subunit, partial [Acidobacteriota bacterium]|nr:efflux RND transporter permease subunit [Acidobacteriota bacterium]
VIISAELIDLGAPVLVELSHRDPARLGPATEALTDHLRGLQGLFEVRSDRAGTLEEIRIELRPEAHALGLTMEGLARELRSAFFGAEALRMQRGGEDVGVYVRLPAQDRDSIADVERYLVRVPGGSASVPLSRIAEARLGSSRPSIPRRDGVRIVTVSAQVDPALVAANDVNAQLADTFLPALAAAHPGLTWAFGGQQRQRDEIVGGLLSGFALAALLIYTLLAVPLRSYTRPLIIMAVIPLGIVGALLGHLIMGVGLSATSMMGMLGLSGIVVNDSLMMVDFIDERRRRGAPPGQAIIDGAKVRFRPILLTSLTTFLGFAPLMLADSEQAGIVAPAAVSMAFGIAFATVVLMLMVPALMTLATGTDRRGEDPVAPEGAEA